MMTTNIKQLVDFSKPYEMLQLAPQFLKEYNSNKELRDAFEHAENNQNEDALKIFEKLAYEDNPFAQEQVAYMYTHGLGTNVDLQKAQHWYQQAANNGNPHSQVVLGAMYANADMGLPLDYKRAEYWYKKAANQDYVWAFYTLSILFTLEDNSSQNLSKAKEWAQKAADLDFAPAQSFLGVLYNEAGDIDKAIYWIEKAATKNYMEAQYQLGYLYMSGEKVARDIDKAKYWLEQSALQNYAVAQNDLGILYKQVYADYEKALYWYTKAAEQGLGHAQNNVAVMYALGLGVSIDLHKAAYWADLAKKNGYDSSLLWDEFELWKYLRKEDMRLFNAIDNNDLDGIRELVASGEDVNEIAGMPWLRTPLAYAAYKNNLECMEVLIELGASINTDNIDDGISPLDSAYNGRSLEAAEFLIKKGSNVNAYGVSTQGLTILHEAAKDGEMAWVKLLIENGADTNIKAVIPEAIKMMHNMGMMTYVGDTPDNIYEGMTPLEVAQKNNQEEVVKYLKKHDKNKGFLSRLFS